MLNNDMPTLLSDPSLLLFHELPLRDLHDMFTDAEARQLATAAGLKSQDVAGLADEVTNFRRSMGWAGRLPDS